MKKYILLGLFLFLLAPNLIFAQFGNVGIDVKKLKLQLEEQKAKSGSIKNRNLEVLEKITAKEKQNLTIKKTVPVATTSTSKVITIPKNPEYIHYHYVLPVDGSSGLSNKFLKEYVRPVACQNDSTNNLLNQGVTIHYSYAVKDRTQMYFISFTKSDCTQYER